MIFCTSNSNNTIFDNINNECQTTETQSLFIMRFLISSIIIALTMSLHAQDTLYFDQSGKKVNSAEKAFRFEVRIADPDNPDCVSISKFNSSGVKTSYVEYKSEKDQIIHGASKKWYDNGQLHRHKKYHEGELHGELLTYWADGTLRRRDNYEFGTLISGKVWDEKGVEMEYYDFQTEPEFPGGLPQLGVFLSQTLRYPPGARRKSIEGTVVVGFIVERDGRINEASIHKSVDRRLDEEALRVVKLIPAFIPGKVEGTPERFQFFLPIRFVLN